MSDSLQTLETLPESVAAAIEEAIAEPAAALPAAEPEPEIESEAEPEAEPAIERENAAARLVTAAVVTFSLTLLAGSFAVLAGVMPLGRMSSISRVNLGAILLFAPLCALVLALLFEVVRMAMKTPLNEPEPRRIPIDWEPGRREG